jgi:predicted permease
LFRRFNVVPNDSYKAINNWIIYLALPAVSLKHLWHLEINSQLLGPALSRILVLGGSFVFIYILDLKFHFDKPTKGLLILASGLCNTSFIGFPLIKTYFGDEFIRIAVISDQMTFLLFSTIGLFIATSYSSFKQLKMGEILLNLIKFPPLVVSIIALLLPNKIQLPVLDNLFTQLASTIAPLALFSIGLQIRISGWRNELGLMIPVFIYKLILAPILVLAYVLLSGFGSAYSQISVFESAMPVLMSLSILCERFQLKTELANLIIGISILLGFISTFFWSLILHQIF